MPTDATKSVRCRRPSSRSGRRTPPDATSTGARSNSPPRSTRASSLHTRLYFSDEAAANGEDLVLNLVPEERRSTLIAERIAEAEVADYRFDVRLQGDDETVFFEL